MITLTSPVKQANKQANKQKRYEKFGQTGIMEIWMKKKAEDVNSQYSLCICMNLIKFNLYEIGGKIRCGYVHK